MKGKIKLLITLITIVLLTLTLSSCFLYKEYIPSSEKYHASINVINGIVADGVIYTKENDDANEYYVAGYIYETLPQNVTIRSEVNGMNVTEIGDAAFYGASIVSITIPDSIRVIGECAFRGSGIHDITIPDGVRSIESNVFRDCQNLRSIDLPNSIEFIGNHAFDHSGLYSITMPDSVTKIDKFAFLHCTKLTSVSFGNGITNVDKGAFIGCDALEAVNIKDIGAWCEINFESDHANPLCQAGNLYLNGELIADIVIPEGTTNIGAYAFYNYTKLTKITIPGVSAQSASMPLITARISRK